MGSLNHTATQNVLKPLNDVLQHNKMENFDWEQLDNMKKGLVEILEEVIRLDQAGQSSTAYGVVSVLNWDDYYQKIVASDSFFWNILPELLITLSPNKSPGEPFCKIEDLKREIESYKRNAMR